MTEAAGGSPGAGAGSGPETGLVGDPGNEPADVGRPATTRASLVMGLGLVLIISVVLAAGAWAGAPALLGTLIAAQLVLAPAWVLGTDLPGRRGGIIIGLLAAAAADTCVTLWPHGRLGVLLPVLGLALPAMFVHQLTRAAARVQVVASLSGVSFLVLLEVAPAALVQLRHEIASTAVLHNTAPGRVSAGVVIVIGAALAAAALADLVVPRPRLDPDVARGVPAFALAAVVGALVGALFLHPVNGFGGWRAAYVGTILGLLAGLSAVAGTFLLHSTTPRQLGPGRALRPVLPAILPFCLLGPVAFLLCLAVRS